MDRQYHDPLASRDLTPREREVLALVAQGLSSRDIAARLHISVRTERTHVAALHIKLHTENRVQLALYALRQEAQR